MMNSKKKSMMIGLSVLIYGLLIVTAFALLNNSSWLPRELKIFAWILLFSIAAIIAFLLILGVFKKSKPDEAETEASSVIDGESKRDIEVSDARLQFLLKGYANGRCLPPVHKPAIEKLVQCGECLPAVVISTEPLLISVYSEQINSAEVYSYPKAILEKFVIVEGSHLIAAASYPQKASKTESPDINAFHAVILNFVSEESAKLSQLSFAIPTRVWKEAIKRGETLAREHPERIRSGDPLLIK